MSENHFSGSLQSLFTYWNNTERAKNFKSGGTRTIAVQYLIDRIEADIHKGIWIDTAVGAGFVQSKVSSSVKPSLIVGIDFSRAMLNEIKDQITHKVLGSVFNLPVRDQSANVVSNVFCLSDYPNPEQAFIEIYRITKQVGIIAYLDYSKKDGYWSRRLKRHGSVGKDNKKIIGNINLREIEEVENLVPSSLRKVHHTTITYDVLSSDLKPNFDMPNKITRAFLYVEYYRPRSR